MRSPRWFHEPTTARVGPAPAYAVATPAAGWLRFLADDDLPFDRRVVAANLALKEDPGCIEAHLFLANHAKDETRARLHLVKAVGTGETLWHPICQADADFSWIGIIATHPFMEALRDLGDFLTDVGELENARLCRDKLRAMTRCGSSVAAVPEMVVEETVEGAKLRM